MKHVYFQHDTTVYTTAIQKMLQGGGWELDFGNYNRRGGVALQHMLEKLGGWQIKYKTLAPQGQKKMCPDRSQKEEGWAFVLKNAPKGRWSDVVMWVDIETSDSSSPISGWNQGMIKEFIRDIHDDKNSRTR